MDRFELIGTGFMTLSELERRLYRYAITEEMGIPLLFSLIISIGVCLASLAKADLNSFPQRHVYPLGRDV